MARGDTRQQLNYKPFSSPKIRNFVLIFLLLWPTRGHWWTRLARLLTWCKGSSVVNYNPSHFLSINEVMVPDLVGFLQYMPMKPTKRGMKINCLRDSTTGYLCDFIMYAGQSRPNLKKNLLTNLICDLTLSFQGKNYFVFMDNWFSSLPRFKVLSSKGHVVELCNRIVQASPKHWKTWDCSNKEKVKLFKMATLLFAPWGAKASKKNVVALHNVPATWSRHF